jgi:hypothetical protein
MTNCVMGFAHRYTADDVRPFVRSLRETAGFDGDIVLFTDEGMNASGLMNCFQVQDIPVGNSFAPWTTGFMKGRFWVKHKFLKENPRYDHAFLADTRDMVFQKDLRQFFVDGLHLARESLNIIDDPGFNARGIKTSYGQEGLDAIGHNPVLNVGSICGDRDSLIECCRAIKESGSSENCDQHGLMWAYYKQSLAATVHENDGSWIWTIGTMMNFEYVFKSGLILLPDESVPGVVHQYDRHHPLREEVLEFYNR